MWYTVIGLVISMVVVGAVFLAIDNYDAGPQ